ncbi:MAG: type II toxin-antitoxin system RelE/ParE family toxin [Deltaproteobacteria bacterium]|nr:type II toxin-antitoxin system RelE/ParE family toxin [Deltaproteobacteria bacterium]
MDFSVEFYETADGHSPVEEFLDDLKASDPDVHAKVLAGLAKLRDRRNHREPLSKPVGHGLFELRALGRLNTRALWFFRHGRRIIVAHGIRHKGQKLPPEALRVARARKADWERRFGR